MADGLDVIIIDDDPNVCQLLTDIIKRFYVWGDTLVFTSVEDAVEACSNRESSLGIFIVDIFLGGQSGFSLLDSLSEKYTSIHEDTIMITGNASDDIVNMCVASGVHHLLEKPVRPYALQLAVRSIISKYLKFAKKLLQDPSYAQLVSRF